MMEVIDTTAMRQVGSRLGSNPAGVFEDDNGRRFYVKSLESPEYARNELIAARLYQLAGAPTLTYLRTTRPNEVATEMLHLDKKSVGQLSPEERRQAQRWFGVHAWTANWDAAGFQGDNQGVAAGRVLTLDVGGALAYRAMGHPKGRAFGNEVGELDRLRNDPDNPYAIKLFGDMDETALIAAIRVIVIIPDALIRQAIIDYDGSTRLAEKMLARKADMAKRVRSDE
jgi:hypothetical protein